MPETATEVLERPAEVAGDAEVAADAGNAAHADTTDLTDARPDEVVAADLLVEEISIDGMCGVY